MKNRKRKSFFVVLITILLLSQNVVMAADTAGEQYSKTIEYLPDGSYYETEIIKYTNARSTVIGAAKTTTYKSDAGKALWYAKVTCDFYFDGSTSYCTSARASAGSYSDVWKILNKSSSKLSNHGSATVEAGCYLNSTLIGKVTRTVTLYCDKNGNLS